MQKIKKSKKSPARIITAEERAACAEEIEANYPGFLEINEKLRSIVFTLTGVRFLYSLFFLAFIYMFDLQRGQGWLNLLSAFFFFIWYSAMLRSGKIVAVVMLIFRGVSIVMAGPSLLSMSSWLPLSLVFALVLSMVIEFIEAVFCIYILFNPTVSQTIILNREMDQRLSKGISKAAMEQMAEYKNPYNSTGSEAEDEEGQETEEN